MPAFEVITKLLIEHAGSHLEQPMCTGHRPSHLLLLDEPPTDDLVDSRLDKASRDRLAADLSSAPAAAAKPETNGHYGTLGDQAQHPNFDICSRSLEATCRIEERHNC